MARVRIVIKEKGLLHFKEPPWPPLWISCFHFAGAKIFARRTGSYTAVGSTALSVFGILSKNPFLQKK
nr:MAG TPA_asm: hypothetical protein [Caudoviricetes sp.]